jgi:hypothetical protein
MGRHRSYPVALVLPAVAVLTLAVLAQRPAAAQLVIASADGGTSFKMGTIVQIQGEDLSTGSYSSDNLFFRRVRLEGLFNTGDLSVYFETDSGTLGKAALNGTKASSTAIDFLDFALTYAFAKEFMLDGGLIRLAPNYDHNISANSTMAMDISPYAYVESTPLTTNSGRDYGVQARGYIDDHLEYRMGVFQGLRGQDDVNAFRYSGRLAWYFFGPEETLSYRGTSLGKIQTLEIGTAFDTQKSYHNYNVDLFYDQPLNGGDGLTLQFDDSWYNANDFLPTLPKQTTMLAEIGYYFHTVKLQPFFQYSREKFGAFVDQPSEERYQVGAGYYFHGQNSNLKFSCTFIDHQGIAQQKDYVLQYQFYVF